MKLLAFDLDGTIVTRDRQIPTAILQALRLAEQTGHLITVVTGRSILGARPIIEVLQLRQPFAVAHGARVLMPEGSVLATAALGGGLVPHLLELAQTDDVLVEIGEQLYVNDPQARAWGWARREGFGLKQLGSYGGEDIDKLLIVTSDPNAAQARYKEAFPELTYYAWSEGFLEITHINGHKGWALEQIAGHIGVERKDVIAFGDGLNDVTMLEWAGIGVAVGDAHPSALAVANDSASAPEHDGIALWLDDHLFAKRSH